jgi:4-amino-4-deoxy-L-arabinose transferase-like glycosyltransferase
MMPQIAALWRRVAERLDSAARGAPAPGFLALAGWFERSAVPACCWIVALWALFVFPAISLRAYHYEEGYIVSVARGVIENGDGLVPHWYGLRYVERPNLMAWIVALFGMAAGGVNQWIARAPAVLSLLASCLLVHGLTRRYASSLAALFAALAVLVSPMILQKMPVAEPDAFVSVLLFLTFIIWWNGIESGRLGIGRWSGITALLALACFVKGPQPIAYYGLGAAAFHLLRREWTSLIPLALAGAFALLITAAWYWAVYEPGDLSLWLFHSRLGGNLTVAQRIGGAGWFIGQTLLELLPALILAAPLIAGLRLKAETASDRLIVALLLYSALATVVLAFWPEANSRYVMPAVPGVAVLAGLGFDRFRGERPALLNAATGVGVALAFYQLVLCWIVMPALPHLFDRSRRAAFEISAAIAAHPATLYALDRDPYNVLGYLSPVRIMPIEDFATLRTPAWALLTSQLQEQQVRDARPDLDMTVAAVVEYDTDRPVHLFYLRPQQTPRRHD